MGGPNFGFRLSHSILELIKRLNFPPEQLELEITESIMMSDVESTEAILVKLAEQAIRLSVDDFGTGYSSLYYLKHFPINALKIDRSFVRDIIHDSDDRAIVTAIVTMAQSLTIETVAEGIEDHAQQDFLREQGCDIAQGFLHSPPIPFSQLCTFLKTYHSDERGNQ